MASPPDAQDANPELESFREQWRAEVRARNTASSGPQQQGSVFINAGTSKASDPEPPRATHLGSGRAKIEDDGDDAYVQTRAFDDPEPSQPGRKDEKDRSEPVTALDHYERAVEREAAGSLGDSLSLYRKAFRMDHKVDHNYRKKHFAAAWAKPAQSSKPTSTTATATASSTAPAQASTSSTTEAKALTAEELIASFSSLSIEPAAPPIRGTPPPPCPIASLPSEILVHVLRDVAAADVGDFVRLSRVCKRLAWLVATEETIWREVCLGRRFGFAGMHYHFQVLVDWRLISPTTVWNLAVLRGLLDQESSTPDDAVRLRDEQAREATRALHASAYGASWRRMFRQRPRVRFNGCYISTVNYIRPGQQVNSVTWNSPVHIVTYYRYLRLFRDGTAISLCTVEEPAAVIHHMTKEALMLHEKGAMAHLPSSPMQHALRARWQLSSAADRLWNEDTAGGGEGENGQEEAPGLEEAEGTLFVENDGGGNYLYRMELALGSAGRGARNNKLNWLGFYSFNKTSEVWDAFTLKQDNSKPWFFSRVKSYGLSEG